MEVIDSEEENESMQKLFQFNHPWFQQNNEFVQQIKTLINYKKIEELFRFSEDYMTSFKKAVLNSRDPEELSREISNLGITFFTPCGKVIEDNEYFYRCLDCDKYRNMESSFVTVICKQCFEKSDHTGHRVFMSQKNNESAGICDCGDPECLEEVGFCKDHKYVKIDPAEILEKFPVELKTRFFEKSYECAYTRIGLLEQALLNPQDKMKGRLILVSGCVMTPACHTFRNLITINKAFIILISYLFRSPLPSGQNVVFHNCDDLESITFTDQPHECKCTLLQIYFRFISQIPPDVQKYFTDLFTELLRDELFKEHINETFCRYILFSVPIFTGSDQITKFKPAVHDVFKLTAQLFGTENLCKIPLNNGTIKNLYKALKLIIGNCKYPGRVISEQLDEIGSIIYYCLLPSHKSAGRELITNFHHFKHTFEILMEYNIKFSYSGKIGIGTLLPSLNYELMNDIFVVSRSIEFLIEKGYKFIEYVPNEEKRALMGIILKEWNEYFQICKDIIRVEMKENPDCLFYPTFERMMTLMLTSFVKPLTKDNLQRLIGETLQIVDQEPMTKFGVDFGENVLNNFGAFRYLQLIHNYQFGPLHLVYLFINNLMHEHDIIALQMTSLLVDKIDIFEYFTKNFFNYSTEISNFLLTGESLNEDERFKEKITVIEDYLFMINHLMNDELCYLSSQTGKKNENIVQDPGFNDRYYKVMKKILINLMASFYWTTLKDIKQRLRNLIKEDKFTEEIISEISDIDSANFKIRLKDQYLKEFDPYFFYKTRMLQRSIVNDYVNRETGSKVDIVSGQFYEDLPQYLYDIQVKFFSSSLLATLQNIIINFKEQYISILGPVLRLIYLNVRLINFLQNEKKDLLISKFRIVFGNNQFIEKLKEMASFPSLQDCHECVNKIFLNLNFLSEDLQLLLPQNTSVNKNNLPKIEKKELARQKMIKLKEEFALRQKTFLDKNITEFSKTSDKEFEDETQKNTCKYCLEELTVEKSFGVPVYMFFTNNFDYNNFSLLNRVRNRIPSYQDTYLNIKTCGHHFHNECYEKIYDQVWEPQNMSRNQNIYWNFFESNCPVCKALVNNFLTINEEPKFPDKNSNSLTVQNSKLDKMITEMQSDQAMPINKPSRNVPFDFIDRVIKFTDYWETRDPFSTKEAISIKEILRLDEILMKSFCYFVESRHLCKSKKDLYESFFNLYYLLVNYYRKCRDGLKGLGEEGANTLFLITNQHFEPKPLSFEDFFKKLRKMFNFEEACLGLDVQIFYACWSALSRVNENMNDVLDFLKYLLIASIVIRAMMFGMLTSTQDINQFTMSVLTDTSVKQKFFESIHQPVTTIVYTFLLLSAQNLSKDCWKETEEKTKVFLNNHIEEEDYFDEVLKVFNDDRLTIKKILQMDQSLGNIIDFKSIISSYQSEDKSPEEGEKQEAPKVTVISELNIKRKRPFFTQLPMTYYEFNSTYLKSQCVLCNEHKMSNNICLCLICGAVICKRKCDLYTEPKFGNLTVHSIRHHASVAIFVDIKELIVYLVCCPEMIVYPCNLYVDKFGTDIKDLLAESRNKLFSLDFKAIYLNKQEIKQLEKIAHSVYEVPYKINELIVKTGKKLKPGYF